VPVSADVLLALAAGALLGVAAAAWRWRRPAGEAGSGAEALSDLRRRLGRAELLARHANDVMVLADESHRLVDVNDRFCQLLGYTREEALRLTVADLRDPATLPDLPSRKEEQLEAGDRVFETRFRRKDGSVLPVEVSVRVVELEGAIHFQAIVRDITERRRMELQLQLADRMASVATLSAGIAHEVNNPLAFVLANLAYALARLDQPLEDPAEFRKALEEARGGAVRVGQIVRDLRTFSRAGEAERSEVDVRQALQTAITLAQTELRQRAQLSLELGPVPPVVGNAHRLGQVFLNLLVNAAQAIPPGAPERHLVQATTAVAPDGRVKIEITDTGVGIPATVLPRIFDPFFTTRAIGQGLGLGLAIVHGIVTDLGGEVVVRSEPGGGSIFTVLLPPAQPGAAAPRQAPPSITAPAPGPAAAGGAEAAPTAGTSILVIDDEPLVGRAITRMLVPPHQVTWVGSAAEALALLGSTPFDTILCDLMMPDMTGMALHDQLRAQAPALASRMVFLTGGAFTPEASEFLDRVPNVRLEKPFTPAELRAAVATAPATPAG
jgi:PAS domain S-box-containing protein